MVGAPVKPTGPPPQPPQKPRPEAPKREGTARRNGQPATIVRALISVVIVWHFAGIFLAALSIGPTSPLVANIAQRPPMQWYLDALYLNQGHSFFAPDVGPGHILRYELFDRSNGLISQGTLPDKKEHWPRLLYHRHMMLADQAETPAEDKATGDARTRATLEAFARHLLRVNRNAQTVRVQLFAHWPLPSYYAAQGRPQGYQNLMRDLAQPGQNRQIDEQGYELMSEGVQRRSDLPPEPEPEPEIQKQSAMPINAPGSMPNSNLNWQSERPNMANRWGGPRR